MTLIYVYPVEDLVSSLVTQIFNTFDRYEDRRKEGLKDSWVKFDASAIRLRRIFDFGISAST